MVFIALAALVSLAYYFAPRSAEFQKFQTESWDKEAKDVLESVYEAQLEYYDKKKIYAKSLKEAKISFVEESPYRVYTDKKQLSQDELVKLDPSFFPFVETDKYLLLLKITRKKSSSIWVMDQTGVPKKIYDQVVLDPE